jgi:hypothetical protein
MKHEIIDSRIGSGSYDPADIEFLLREIRIAPTPVAEKEAAIQSGRAHYSEMISEEARPDPVYLRIFDEAWAASRNRIATEVLGIAAQIRLMILEGILPPEISLCSLVRAGAPLGVLLRRALVDAGVDVRHYGVSIIRDRGLDMTAMAQVMAERNPDGILFVDGWTGKGAIAAELRRSWIGATGKAPRLVVLADPCGEADLSGSHDDWLIPTGLLGANISGLISRSILEAGSGERLHAAMPVAHLADIDRSRDFVEDIHAEMRRIAGGAGNIPVPPLRDPSPEVLNFRRARARRCLEAAMSRFEVGDRNRVKPGIAEATRAVLRRRPEVVILSDAADPDLAGIRHLCTRADVPVIVGADLTGPWRAITLIGKVSPHG